MTRCEGTLCFLALLAVIALFALSGQAQQAGEIIARILDNIPLTNHAANAHAGQLWTATSIIEYMQAGKCQPRMYACPGQDIEIYYCELNPGKSIGVVVGATVRQVITGLMARTSWWQDRCK